MSSTAHSSARRSEAGVRLKRDLMPESADLAQAQMPQHRNNWIPVQGPHLRTVRKTVPKNRTGCPGISYVTRNMLRKNGTVRTRTYFEVNRGKSSRPFCIETLGRNEAWRAALKCRAAHEIKIQDINNLIIHARKQNSGSIH